MTRRNGSLVNMPEGLLEETDRVAQFEHRSRSGLVREAVRRYIQEFQKNGTVTAVEQLSNGSKVMVIKEARAK